MAEKLKEVKGIENSVLAKAEDLSSPGIGMIRKEDGTFVLVKLVFDLEKNAAAIVETENVSGDSQVAGGTLMREIGKVFYKAAGIK